MKSRTPPLFATHWTEIDRALDATYAVLRQSQDTIEDLRRLAETTRERCEATRQLLREPPEERA